MATKAGQRNTRRCVYIILFLCSSLLVYMMFGPDNSFKIPVYCQELLCKEGHTQVVRRGLDYATVIKENLFRPECSCYFGTNIFLSHNQRSVGSSSEGKEEQQKLSVPSSGKIIIDESLLTSLLKLEDKGDQQIYLYEQLLTKDWQHNETNLDEIRKELAAYRPELNGSSHLILDQENVKDQSHVINWFQRIQKSTPSVHYGLPVTSPFPTQRRFKTCAVVGNSGSIKGSGCGATIDSNEYVFRCNIAPLGPFKDDAGMRSNLTTMNPSILRYQYGSLNGEKAKRKFNEDISQYKGLLWVPCMMFSWNFYSFDKMLKYFKGQDPEIVCGHPDHLKYTTEFWAQRSLHKRMSTGFYLVTVAFQLCDQIDLYGFWPFPVRYGDRMPSLPYHYFDSTTSANANSDHALSVEFNFMVQLHNLGVVRLHPGSCPDK